MPKWWFSNLHSFSIGLFGFYGILYIYLFIFTLCHNSISLILYQNFLFYAPSKFSQWFNKLEWSIWMVTWRQLWRNLRNVKLVIFFIMQNYILCFGVAIYVTLIFSVFLLTEGGFYEYKQEETWKRNFFFDSINISQWLLSTFKAFFFLS